MSINIEGANRRQEKAVKQAYEQFRSVLVAIAEQEGMKEIAIDIKVNIK